MKNRKTSVVTVSFVLAVSLISSSLTAVLLAKYYNHVSLQIPNILCREIINRLPEAKPHLLEILKEYRTISMTPADENFLFSFGYRGNYFLESTQSHVALFAGIGFAVGALLFLIAFWFWHRKEVIRIQTLTAYLEKVNTGSQGLLLSVSEDEFSKLEDEIYKTVTALYQTRDAAVEAKKSFADNLSNIVHQLKTPITSISLSTQMMKENPSPEYLLQIQKQLNRLTHLEESLLLLSRIDSGTLSLKKETVDVFTMLTLAADNLQELFSQKNVFLDIPEMKAMEITADLDWTMEAFMNLFKNCMEHTPAGQTVHCSCEQNPLYTQIRIWDEGSGFHKEDIPHLFECFYRGQNADANGVGIGLSLSKAIIEMQNGVISADNLQNGGACFEIRMYSH